MNGKMREENNEKNLRDVIRQALERRLDTDPKNIVVDLRDALKECLASLDCHAGRALDHGVPDAIDNARKAILRSLDAQTEEEERR